MDPLLARLLFFFYFKEPDESDHVKTCNVPQGAVLSPSYSLRQISEFIYGYMHDGNI
jgi:hypothetical protein